MKVGDQITLMNILYDRRTDQYVRATLYADGEVFGSPVAMPHVNNGIYIRKDPSLIFPTGVVEIRAVYEVYSDPNFLNLNRKYAPSEDTFQVSDEMATEIEGRLDGVLAAISEIGFNSALTGFVDHEGSSDYKISVIRGEDRDLLCRVLNKDSEDPFDLTGVTLVSAYFKQSDRTALLEKTSAPYGKQASGEYQEYIFTADNQGLGGHNILLHFNGTDSVAQVVLNWNTANPTNTVSFTPPEEVTFHPERRVLSVGNLRLSGGIDPGTTDIEIVSAKLGKIRIKLDNETTNRLRLGRDQGFKVYIDRGQHPDGERRIVFFNNCLEVVDSSI